MKTVITQILRVIRFVSACVALIMALLLGIDCYLGAATYEWLMSSIGANISIDSFFIPVVILSLLFIGTTLLLEKLDE